MMRRRWLMVIIAGCISCMIGASTAWAGHVPGLKTYTPVPLDYTEADVDNAVVAQEVAVEPYRHLAQYGVNPASIPAGCDCDTVKFIRYRLKDSYLDLPPDKDTKNANYADAGLLMVPGVLEGANGFEYIARHLVYQGYLRGKKIEVWAMDRRGNCIEDTRGAEAIEEMYNYDVEHNIPITQAVADAMMEKAIDYYYRKKAINGKTFAGWYKGSQLPFLAEFGLKMDTEDMFQIIEAMVPNQADRKAKVFIGGHSLGGLHASFFAAWDKDGNPATTYDAGYNNTAGLFCFDSILTPLDTEVSRVIQQFLPISDYVIGFGEEMTEPVYQLGLAGLRSGVVPRIAEGQFANALVGSPIGPEVMTLIEAIGALAYVLPDQELTALRQAYSYMGSDVKETLQKYISKDTNQWLWKEPTILDYRFTNEAMLGLFFDDDFTHISMIRASMGFMYNGEVETKDTLVYWNPMMITSSSKVYVPTQHGYDYWWWGWHHVDGPLYKWANFDQVARPGHPLYSTDGKITYTNYENEMSSIHSLARALFKGPTNLVEWYFPIRKILDMVAAIGNYGRKYGLNSFYADAANALPKKEFVGGQGVLGPFEPLLTDSPTIPGMNHMDPMFTSANTSGFKANPVIRPLLDFVEANRAH